MNQLSKKQQIMLCNMAVNFGGIITPLMPGYSVRAGNALVGYGFAKLVMGSLYEITDNGRERCKTIY